MPGYLALVGGDEFRPGCEEFDMELIRCTEVENPRLLIIPTAAALENPTKAASTGVRYFVELGANASEVMVLNASNANDPDMASEIKNAHIIYFTGGDPKYLVESLYNSLFFAEVTDALGRGTIIAGSSAGAMMMGSWMRYRTWQRALGLSEGIATLPHHERADPKLVCEELSKAPNELQAVFGICGRTGCLGSTSGRWSVHGSGHVIVYQHNSWDKYESGDTFNL